LTGIAEVGNDSRNSASGRPMQAIHHDNQFHKIIVTGGARRLDDKNILTSYILDNFNADFAIAKAPNLGIA
jgi:hypothetical protein